MTPGYTSVSSLLNGPTIRRLCTALLVVFPIGMLVISAQTPSDVDFAELIRTPANLQRTLEHCDGHPAFETALANWLETAEPPSLADRDAVHKASLRLLQDTTDAQLVLSLSDGLLRHALKDVNREQSTVPEALALTLYSDIGRSVAKQRSKLRAIPIPAYGLAEDGTVKDERQARFLEKFLDLAEPHVAHSVAPSQPKLPDSTRAAREQSERKNSRPTQLTAGSGSALPAGRHAQQ